MSKVNWSYDETNGRYIVKNARIMFPNFEGAEQDYNQAGKRNFRLLLDEELAEEMRSRGVHVRYREARDENEEDQYLMKVSIYGDADIRFFGGKGALQKIVIDNNDPDNDQAVLVDEEFRKGHIKNGEIALEFHVSRNTRVQASSPYVRVDTMVLPIRRSRLLEEYEDIESDVFDD